MPLALPRGLSPLRLLVVFFVLISLFIFRSYYLPDTEQSNFSVSSLSSPGEWLSGALSSNSDDMGDVDVDNDFSPSDPTSLVSEINDFTDSVDATPSSPSEPAPEPTSQSGFDPSIPLCRRLPGADKVVVMVKTGATEVFNRIPEQLLTLAECAPNFMVFSDMEQDMGEFHIYDALDEIGKEYKENHEDFQFYNSLQKAQAAHGDLSVLGSEKGWNLDKWKNIPMLHKAYTRYPEADWYITIDADSYLGWSNLLRLLSAMDPNEPLYAGCVYWHGPTAFAQGGTGYLLSRNAVERFESIRNPEKIADWEKETSTICCGDVMLGVAMGHAGVSVSGAWPMFQVDPPSALGWSDSYWCKPPITWHHAKPYEVEALWNFEKEWLNKTWDEDAPGSTAYRYSDVFEHFIQPHVEEDKSDWNNFSGDKIFTEPKEDHVREDHDWDNKNDDEKKEMWDGLSEIQQRAVESVENCREACQDDAGCMQFTWHPGTCRLHYSIRLGVSSKPELEMTSGWMSERIEQFKKDRGECDDINWDVDR